jgi:hypothetical protein
MGQGLLLSANFCREHAATPVYKLGLLDHLAQAHEIYAILVTELSRWGTDSDWARGVGVGIPDDPQA